MPPCPVARSTSSRIRFLSSALNLRRCALADTSGSGELVTKGTAIFGSVTMIPLAALLCNYGRGFCLIDIGTEGRASAVLLDDLAEKDGALPIDEKGRRIRRLMRCVPSEPVRVRK